MSEPETLKNWFEEKTGTEWKRENLHDWLKDVFKGQEPETVDECPKKDQLGSLNEHCRDGTGIIIKTRIQQDGTVHRFAVYCVCHPAYSRFGIYGAPAGFPWLQSRDKQDRWLEERDFEPVYYDWDDMFH